MMPPACRVLISAAEPSGDRLAAELIQALGQTAASRGVGPVAARGVAGPAMRAVGTDPVGRIEDVSVMGISEVLRHLGRIRRTRAAMEAAIDQGGDVLIVVDAPDFHLPLAARAHAAGIPVVGVVSPQIWAWRPGRARKIAACMDRLCCLFAFEPAVYDDVLGTADRVFQAIWTGHPVVDRLARRDPSRVDSDLYAILPGSRRQELARHLPVFLATAQAVHERHQGARFLLPTRSPPPGLPSWVQPVADVAALDRCRAVLSKSGTVTLELAVMGVPMVVAHRVHPLTWWIGRLLVRQVHHLAMPNVLADRTAGAKAPELVPEHLQALDPRILAAELLALPQLQPLDLSALGPPGAADRAAAQVAELLGWPPPG